MSFIKDKSHFGHCIELLNASVKPYHISSFKNQLDESDLKIIVVTFSNSTLWLSLITTIYIKTETRENINYMVLGDRVHKHKDRLKKENTDDSSRHIHNQVTPKYHSYMTSQLNFINKIGRKVSNQYNIDSEKKIECVKNPYKRKWENRNSQ